MADLSSTRQKIADALAEADAALAAQQDLQAQITQLTSDLATRTTERDDARTANANALAKLQDDKAADATADAARDAAIAILGG